MDVVLTQDVLDLGDAGEVKSVADGYARNYLIPRGMAVLATKSARKQIEDIRNTASKRRARERGTAELLAQKIEGLPLTFVVKVGEGDRLYGSITSSDIGEAIEQAIGEEVDRRRIALDRPIKTLGDHPVPVRLAKDLAPEVIVTVVSDQEPEAEAAEEAESVDQPESVEEVTE
jgi:large subunit ribosomal protein L9